MVELIKFGGIVKNGQILVPAKPLNKAASRVGQKHGSN